jgi:uncharacterized protein YfaS (alpha-2-macroglobulin family)
LAPPLAVLRAARMECAITRQKQHATQPDKLASKSASRTLHGAPEAHLTTAELEAHPTSASLTCHDNVYFADTHGREVFGP